MNSLIILVKGTVILIALAVKICLILLVKNLAIV